MDDEEVKAELNEGVDKLQTDWLLGLREQRPESVEEGLETDPEELAKRCAKQPGLQLRRDVGVYQISALVLWGKKGWIGNQKHELT